MTDSNKPHAVWTLQALVFATCLRRTKETARGSVQLPDITEETQIVQFTDSERDLYNYFQKYASEIVSKTTGNGNEMLPGLGRNILPLINFLRLICNHGLQLLPDTAIQAWNNRQSEPVNWERIQDQRATCSLCQSELVDTELVGEGRNKEWKCGHSVCGSCLLKQDDALLDVEESTACPVCVGIGAESIVVRQDATLSEDDYHPSSKMKELLLKLHEEQKENKSVSNAESVKR